MAYRDTYKYIIIRFFCFIIILIRNFRRFRSLDSGHGLVTFTSTTRAVVIRQVLRRTVNETSQRDVRKTSIAAKEAVTRVYEIVIRYGVTKQDEISKKKKKLSFRRSSSGTSVQPVFSRMSTVNGKRPMPNETGDRRVGGREVKNGNQSDLCSRTRVKVNILLVVGLNAPIL